MSKTSTVVFFYGFPRDSVTSYQIQDKIRELTGIDVRQNIPQIKRINMPEWSALVKLETPEEKKKVLEKMRFFKWYAGNLDRLVEIRALDFDPEYKKRDDPEVQAKNVFCKYIPDGMTHSDLYAELSKFTSEGDIKSVKVSIDPRDNSSNNYGYASFATTEAAQQFIDRSAKDIESLKPFEQARNKARVAFEKVSAELKALIKKKNQLETEEAKEQLEEEQKELRVTFDMLENELETKEDALKYESEKLGLLFQSYNHKNKAEMRQVFNNIIVKGFQQDASKVDDAEYL